MKPKIFFSKLQKASMDSQTSDRTDEQVLDESKRPMTDWEMYNDLLTMNMFANYYPHVFPDHNMFR
jgi:hypothetical protein